MKNSVADRANAQGNSIRLVFFFFFRNIFSPLFLLYVLSVSCAGQFIHNHIPMEWMEKGGEWAHIDMAYCVYDKKDERATGYGVALLNAIVEKLD